MKIPKRYGQSITQTCPFCGKTAVTENPEGVSVCINHKSNALPEMKCMCGEWLDLRKGKWGPYFHCVRCGSVNFKRALETNPPIKDESRTIALKSESTATTVKAADVKKRREPHVITSDEVDAYYS